MLRYQEEPRSQALVLIAPESASDPAEALSKRFRHNSFIVTQLWAAKLDAPQARARRKAAPGEGTAAYGATEVAIRTARRTKGDEWAA